MKYLTFKEVHQKITDHESYDMDDFINAYISKEIKIYLNHTGLIVKNFINPNTKMVNSYSPDSVKAHRGLIEPLDDIFNQDIVSLLQGQLNTIIYATIDNEIYTLLRKIPTETESFDITHLAKLYTTGDLLIEKEQFESLCNINSLYESRSDRSIELENTKLLRIIGSILAGLDKSKRYGDLTQNSLYDLMTRTVDLEKLRLGNKTVEKVFSKANDAIENHLI
ncbi:hypothetical protein [Acinetobacter celticus]|uniref:Uncharacterized protein n=1 Tax=Acinetobacter celticus TaxID=1891224 RepID=A0A1C3D0G2_9GAMM|nr:hypothetical protein [Acinetobacter celticus]ODA14536.1 hypothetical protein BBP83_01670 [Acinetobacter celticus]